MQGIRTRAAPPITRKLNIPIALTDVAGQCRLFCRRYLLWKNDGNSIGQPTYIWLQPLSEDGLRFTAAPTQLIRNDRVRPLAVLSCSYSFITLMNASTGCPPLSKLEGKTPLPCTGGASIMLCRPSLTARRLFETRPVLGGRCGRGAAHLLPAREILLILLSEFLPRRPIRSRMCDRGQPDRAVHQGAAAVEGKHAPRSKRRPRALPAFVILVRPCPQDVRHGSFNV